MPTTPFEDRGFTAPWTTHEEELAFVDALLADTTTLTRTVWGQSVLGRDMYTLSIGTGPVHVLIVAAQHGMELAGRDAALTRIRDWASTTDPALLDYFTRVTVHVMPAANPDTQTRRLNVNDIDTGRNHIRLTAPESQSVQRAIITLDPDMVIDLHEGVFSSTQAQTLPSLNANVHPAILGLSAALDSATSVALQGAGLTWAPYRDGATIEPQNLCNQTGLGNRVSMLVESGYSRDHDNNAQIRYEIHLTAVDTALAWHSANLAAVRDAIQVARAGTAAYRGTRKLMIAEDATSGRIVDVPDGYVVTAAQWETLAPQRDLLGIIGAPLGDGRYVISTAQEAQAHVVYALDPQAQYRVLSGLPWMRQGEVSVSAPQAARVRANGVLYDVSGAVLGADGQSHLVRFPN